MAKAALGSGERFQQLETNLSHQRRVRNPGGLAASIGRKKYGNRKFQSLATYGRRHHVGFDPNHKELSREIKHELGRANKSLTTAQRFGNETVYNSGEGKLRHALSDVKSVANYKVSRISALRHAVGFAGRKPHPPGCRCPFHQGHK